MCSQRSASSSRAKALGRSSPAPIAATAPASTVATEAHLSADQLKLGRHVGRRRGREGGSSLHVLLGDDDIEMRRLIAAALRRDGCVVIEAHSGVAMLDVLASELLRPGAHAPVDLIISDYCMPGVTGLSLLSGLRDSDWQTPFILITAFGGAEVHDRAIRDGASAYFEKPFDLDELREKVLELTAVREPGRPRCAMCGGRDEVRADDLVPDCYVCLECLHYRDLGGEG